MPILTKTPAASSAPISVAFVPTTVASCRLWLDASDTATITQNATSNISQWSDKSGNGLNAISNNVIGWAVPTYVSTGAIKYVSMTPGQALYVPDFSYNTAWSVFSCMCNVTLGARWYISPYADLGIVLMGMGHGGNKVFSGMLGGGNDVTGSHIEYTSAQNTNGTGAYTYYRDGSLIDSNNTANGIPSATVRMGIGANGAATFDVDGTYYPFEIIMFNQYLGDTDRRNVEGYLAQKWGLTANLPAGHPGLTSNYLVSSAGPAPDVITFIRAAGPLSSGFISPIYPAVVSAGTGGSFLFNATPTQYLSIPNSTSFTQNTAFTYELWYYPTSTNSGYIVAMLQHNWITVKWMGAGKIGLDMSYVGNAPGYTPQNRTYAINRWHHIALSWNGTNGVLYMNGVSECTFTGAGATVGDGNPLYIGQYQGQGQPTPQGYFTNFRFVKGVSVYTGAFTPPTAPLTITQSAGTNISAITAGQTQVLLSVLNTNSLVTDSTGNFTVTNNGSVSWNALTPF